MAFKKKDRETFKTGWKRMKMKQFEDRNRD